MLKCVFLFIYVFLVLFCLSIQLFVFSYFRLFFFILSYFNFLDACVLFLMIENKKTCGLGWMERWEESWSS